VQCNGMLNTYKGRTVLLTGHTGFKGSWLSIWLRELGARVIGYSLDPPSYPSNFHASRLHRKVIHVHGDVRDARALSEVFDRYRPEVVIHMAAQAIVRASYEDPKTTFDTNIGGTVNVLECVRAHPDVRVLINITSDKCYENREWVWGYRENDPMGGNDPYSASKGCAELVFSSYLRSFFPGDGRRMGMASVRAGNVVGGGDWAKDRLIPDCVRAIVLGRPITIRNPRSVRPWQHVLEPLSGYLCLGSLLWDHGAEYSGAWNFGPDGTDDATVQDVLEKFISLWGSGSWHDGSGGAAPHESMILRLSCEKAKRHLKWRSVLSLDQCLQMTADWYKTFYAQGKEMYRFCAEQIDSYREKAGEQGLAWAD
jgi:CDP-glucose 4,6-dehydratase